MEGPSEAVNEAYWNRATHYYLLEDMPKVAEVLPSNPAKNRIIANAHRRMAKIA